jgi:hypothetical protein
MQKDCSPRDLPRAEKNISHPRGLDLAGKRREQEGEDRMGRWRTEEDQAYQRARRGRPKRSREERKRMVEGKKKKKKKRKATTIKMFIKKMNMYYCSYVLEREIGL